MGKKANFAVLNQHPYDVEKTAPETIKDIEVHATIFNGNIIEVEKVSQGLVLNQEGRTHSLSYLASIQCTAAVIAVKQVRYILKS